MNKQEFLEQAAKKYKLLKLRIQQRAYGTDIMDEVAVRLNCSPTYQEQQHIKAMWNIFRELGAKLPEESEQLYTER